MALEGQGAAITYNWIDPSSAEVRKPSLAGISSATGRSQAGFGFIDLRADEVRQSYRPVAPVQQPPAAEETASYLLAAPEDEEPVRAATAPMEHPDTMLVQPLAPPGPAAVEALLAEVAAAVVAPAPAAAQQAPSKRYDWIDEDADEVKALRESAQPPHAHLQALLVGAPLAAPLPGAAAAAPAVPAVVLSPAAVPAVEIEVAVEPVVPVAAAAVPPTPERAEGAPPARRASRLPRIKLPFVELPERRPQSAGEPEPTLKRKLGDLLGRLLGRRQKPRAEPAPAAALAAASPAAPAPAPAGPPAVAAPAPAETAAGAAAVSPMGVPAAAAAGGVLLAAELVAAQDYVELEGAAAAPPGAAVHGAAAEGLPKGLAWGCPPEWPSDVTPQPSAHEQPPPDWAAGPPPGREWVPEWGCPPLWEVPAPSGMPPPPPPHWGEDGEAKPDAAGGREWSYYGCPPLAEVPVLPEPATPPPPPHWGKDARNGPPHGAEWSFYGCPEVEESDATPHPRRESPPSWGDPATQTPPQQVALSSYPASPFVGGQHAQESPAGVTPPMQLRIMTSSTCAVSSQDDSAAAEAAQDEWGAGEGATVRSPLLDRARPYAVPAGRAESDPALPRPADLPRVAVRAEHGGHRGDQGGLYFDYGGVWGADPVGETPKPYPVTTEEPPPPHWGLEERESTVEDTALDEASKEDVEGLGEVKGEFQGGPSSDNILAEEPSNREALELPPEPWQQGQAEPPLHPADDPTGFAEAPAAQAPLPRTPDAAQHGSTLGGAALAATAAALARERTTQGVRGPEGSHGGSAGGSPPPLASGTDAPHGEGASRSAGGLPDVLRSPFVSPPLPAAAEEITADAPPTPQLEVGGAQGRTAPVPLPKAAVEERARAAEAHEQRAAAAEARAGEAARAAPPL